MTRSPAFAARTILSGLVFSVAVLILAPATQAASPAQRLKEGNVLYRKGQYSEALEKYTEAQVEHPDDPRFLYNVANAKHKVAEYDEAITLYTKAALSADLALEERCYYNIGNSLYRQGKLQEAIEYYQRALALDPDDEDAKYNIEFVREEIKRRINEQKKRQEEEAKQEQGNQDAQQEPSDQQGTDQQQPSSPDTEDTQQEGQEDQEGQSAENGQGEQQQEEQQQEEQQHAGATPDAEDQASSGSAEQERPDEGERMSQREADLWLNSLEGEKDEALKQWFRSLAGVGNVRVEKDW